MRNNIGWFRGKWKETGEWVQGYYVHLIDYYKNRESHRIYPGTAETDCGDFYSDYYEVDPNTVGACTGLTDKNGKLIFEGDIVEGADFQAEDGYAVIRWDDDTARFTISGDGLTVDFDNYWGCDLVVIGNIHDNPELLE